MNAADNDGEWDAAGEDPPRRSRWRLLLIGVLVALTAAAAVGAWLAWQGSTGGSGNTATLPILTAPTGPDKRRPDEPGGLTVPHQDKLVYDRLIPGTPTRPVEQLLPAPETPVERPRPPEPQAAPQVAAANPPASPPPSATLPGSVMPPPAAAPAQPATVNPLPPPGVLPAPVTPPTVVTQAVSAAPAPVPAPGSQQVAAASPAAAPAPGGWRVQLASVGEWNRAQSEWTRIQRRAAPLLDGMSPVVVEVKLERGTFWRIQAAPLTDREAAAGLCGKLKAQSLDCLVVAP